MLQERGRIDNSHNMMDSVLSQAYAVNESFGVQRETLASINRRIVGAASQVPGINGLINRIGAKRRRMELYWDVLSLLRAGALVLSVSMVGRLGNGCWNFHHIEESRA